MIRNWPERFRTLPTPMAGLALGVASVLWCADGATGAGGALQLAGAFVAACLLALLLVRALFHFDTILSDVRHPVAGSILPTFAMCLMVISASLSRLSPAAGRILWCIAVALHLLILAGFLFSRVRSALKGDRAMDAMVPSWFIPPVGIVVADVTFPGDGALLPVALGCLWLGLACYAVLLPVMLCRLCLGPEIAAGARPTLAIMAAPASLSLAGYLTVVEAPNLLLCAVLLGIALLMTTSIYFAFWHLLRLKFSPGYAAFTFPMAIGATALYKSAAALERLGAAEADGYATTLRLLAHGELIVALVVIAYVFALYAKNFPLFLKR